MTPWGWGRGGGYGGAGHLHEDPEHMKMVLQLAKQLPRPPKPGEGCVRVAAGVQYDAGLNSPVMHGIAHAPYVAIVDICNGRVVNVIIAPNPLAEIRGGVGIAMARWIADIGAKIVVAGHVGPHMAEALQRLGVRIIPAYPGEPLASVLARAGLIQS